MGLVNSVIFPVISAAQATAWFEIPFHSILTLASQFIDVPVILNAAFSTVTLAYPELASILSNT